MNEITKQETENATTDASHGTLALNKDTLQDLDAPQAEQVKGGAIGSFVVCESDFACRTDLCLTTTGTR